MNSLVKPFTETCAMAVQILAIFAQMIPFIELVQSVQK